MGFVERGGRVRTKIIDDTSRWTLTREIKANVALEAHIMTDFHFGYKKLTEDGYKHDSVNHSLHYVDKDDKSIHTQSIEGFWSQLKRGITGTYRKVSPKYLQNYCNEFAFRYSYRDKDIFEILLSQVSNQKT